MRCSYSLIVYLTRKFGQGVGETGLHIVPIHKHDSRLDPVNYRPITPLAGMGMQALRLVNYNVGKLAH